MDISKKVEDALASQLGSARVEKLIIKTIERLLAQYERQIEKAVEDKVDELMKNLNK